MLMTRESKERWGLIAVTVNLEIRRLSWGRGQQIIGSIPVNNEFTSHSYVKYDPKKN